MESTSVGVSPMPEPSCIGPSGRRGRERAPRGWGTRGVCCAWGQLKLKPATACAQVVSFFRHHSIAGRIAQCRLQLTAGHNRCYRHRRGLPA